MAIKSIECGMDEVDRGNKFDISYLKETVGPLNIPKALLADILSGIMNNCLFLVFPLSVSLVSMLLLL